MKNRILFRIRKISQHKNKWHIELLDIGQKIWVNKDRFIFERNANSQSTGIMAMDKTYHDWLVFSGTLKLGENIDAVNLLIMDKIINEIKAERERQNAKWGEQNHSLIEWIGILTEEVGEASKEAVDYHFNNPYIDGCGELQNVEENDVVQSIRLSNYRNELIQVAAVAVQMIECLDRNGR